jgi:hypothetical protein
MPKACPQCRRISPDGSPRCDCGYDLTGVAAFATGPKRLVCRCRFTLGDVVGHLLTWLLLACLTAGLALPCYPHYFARFILQRTSWWEE